MTALLMLAAHFVAGCGLSREGWGVWDGEVISRVPSPDSAVEAIIGEGRLGATTGFSSRGYIVAPGTEFDNKTVTFDDGREILRADDVDGLELKWKDPKTLEISFRSARIFHYRNFFDYGPPGYLEGRYEIKLVELSRAER